MTRQQLLIIAGGAAAIIIVLFLFGLIKSPRATPATLEVWGVYEEKEVFQDLIANYQKENRHITINYQKKAFADYEKELINAFAAGQGPDIWLIHNTWLPRHKDKTQPIPAELFSFTALRENFVDVVEKDFSQDNKIYALPLYVDSLALFYNKDILNSAGISSPPETWEELIDDLDKLVQKNQWGGIERAGIALGTGENINRSTDILALLMLQNGTKMISDDKKSAVFGETGKNALEFYTDFANPVKRTYTWNRQMPYSIDAFVEGKAVMMINYSHHIATIKDRVPYLSFDIAPMPQIKDREFDIDYANYWAFTVSKKSKAIKEAWKFIIYLSQKENAKNYLRKAKKPTSRRDLIDWQKQDLELKVFAMQSLSARNWYQADSNAIETILAEAIKSVILGKATVNKAIQTATNQISLLMK